MSAAAELRTAASILRENANGATPGPWGWKPANPNKLEPLDDASLTGPSCRFTSGDALWIRDAVYITTMDPIVGAALAGLLDEVADHAESNNQFDGFPPESVITGYTHALTIARLINGGASCSPPKTKRTGR